MSKKSRIFALGYKLYCDRNCCVKDKKSNSYKIINPNKKMKKIKEPQVKVVKFEKVDIIATSGLVSTNTASVNVNHHEYGTDGVVSWF